MSRHELRFAQSLLLIAGLALTNACVVENSEKSDATGGSTSSGGQSNTGGASAGGASSGGASSGGASSGGASSGGASAGGAAGAAGAAGAGSGGDSGSGGLPGVGGLPGTGGAGAGGSGAGGSGNLPWPVKSCADLCQYQPTVTAQETQCVTVQAELKGYPVTSTPTCLGIFSVAQCNACYATVKMSDADCASIGGTCLK